MNSIDLIRMGLKNLWRRKLRTFLTVLGVVIGTASIIIMISLGLAMTHNFTQEISRMGSLNVIDVYSNSGGGYYEMAVSIGGSGNTANATLDDAAVLKIGQISGVEAVTPVLESYYKFVSGKYAAQIPVKGIRPEAMADFDFPIREGRLLQEDDDLNIVFGQEAIRQFYDIRGSSRRMYFGKEQQEEVLVDVLHDKLVMTSDFNYGERQRPTMEGEQERKKPTLYKVKGVGILEEGNFENDYYAYMSIYELEKIIDETNREQQEESGTNRSMRNNQQNGYQRVMVKVTDFQQVKEISQQIRDMGFQTNSLTDILDSVQKQYSQLQAILGGIGAVSLLVAAIGITNTMIMSIYERTKEIGVMKVIGAALSDIRRLFLLESGLIGLMGGILGLGLSYLLSYILNTSGMSLFGGMGGPGSKMSVIPVWLVGYTLIFSTLVGLLSGFGPARRAMKLSALEAIRTE